MNQQLFKNKIIVMLLANDFTHDSRVLKEALSAKKAGFKVFVLARKSINTAFSETKYHLEIIRVQTFIDRWFDQTIRKKNANRKNYISSKKAPDYSTEVLSSLMMVFNVWLLNYLMYLKAQKIHPDLVHANDTSTLLAGYALQRKGAKLIYDAHELYLDTKINPHLIWLVFFRWIEKKINQVDAIFSVNDSILRILKKRYKTSKIPQAILYNGPNYQKISPKKIKNNQKIKAIYVGSYSPNRNLEILFKAIKNLTNFDLTIIGPGWKIGRYQNIEFIKAVPPDKLVRIITQYDIGIIPYSANNLNNLYSTPNKLFEYMMAGLAVVASDLPEIRKIIQASNNGLLYKAQNSQDLETKLQKLLTNYQKLTNFKNNSLKSIKNYTWELQEKKQLEVYHKILLKNA